MIATRSTVGTIQTLINHLKTSGFRVEARILREDPDTSAVSVELSGEDIALFEENDGALIQAIRHLASAALRLPPEDEDSIRFNVESLHSIGGPSGGGRCHDAGVTARQLA